MDSHSYAGNSIPVSPHPPREEFLPNIPSIPVLWQWKAIPPYPVPGLGTTTTQNPLLEFKVSHENIEALLHNNMWNNWSARQFLTILVGGSRRTEADPEGVKLHLSRSGSSAMCVSQALKSGFVLFCAPVMCRFSLFTSFSALSLAPQPALLGTLHS